MKKILQKERLHIHFEPEDNALFFRVVSIDGKKYLETLDPEILNLENVGGVMITADYEEL
jgi:hypothetical protein